MSASSIPTLKALRETPTACIYAVGASAASLVELLGAVLGNSDTALAVLNQFPTLEDIARVSNTELDDKPAADLLNCSQNNGKCSREASLPRRQLAQELEVEAIDSRGNRV